MKSASRHGLPETHTPPAAARIPFETLVREMLELLSRVSGHSPRIRIDPSRVRANDPASVYGDSTRLREATRWVPTISLEQSLSDMLAQV